ncbi:HD domain-containing protein [Actinomadura chibensis]|uniref:HD domain-containing protein n=1 Tax=Actinomadura chibensis TaxID=392828 RepID=UPI001471E0A7
MRGTHWRCCEGKSAGRAGGRANLLLQHLLDTATVAELVWDFHLALSVRRMLDGVAGESALRTRGWSQSAFQDVQGVP